MILESIIIVAFALGLDFTFGDPKNKYHPTAWIGTLIANFIPLIKSQNVFVERLGGIFVIVLAVGIAVVLLSLLSLGILLFEIDWLVLVISVLIGALLLKSTIAIKGMERHALNVVHSLEQDNIVAARNHLSMIVKRNTKNLDKNHVISGVLESISENTVDGITGPLFYYAVFGLPGAFTYRIINTADSMIGYKNNIFKNIGWFAAKCDTILNYIPSRLTGLLMILSAALLQNNWKESYKTMFRDGRKTESTNAGYPMAALAGALETKFEKINHYKLGNGNFVLTNQHIYSALTIMKLTSVLFFGIITIPIISVLSILGWWIHA